MEDFCPVKAFGPRVLGHILIAPLFFVIQSSHSRGLVDAITPGHGRGMKRQNSKRGHPQEVSQG
jgi:hypothetical protein